MKVMRVGYDVGCTIGLTLGHGAWQTDRPSNGSMWNSYSFQPVGQWMGYSFTDFRGWGVLSFTERLVQAIVTKFFANVGLNMLINISPRFYHIGKKYFGECFSHFPTAKSKKNCLFIPQPSGLEGYCRHGSGGRAGGRWLPNLWNPYLCNRLTDFLHSKFCGIIEACSCALSCHLPICPIWACPWAKNLSNLPQIWSRLCGTHISETTGWIYLI